MTKPDANGWMPIETAPVHDVLMPHRGVDLFSSRNKVRSPDCGYHAVEQAWISRHQWVDDKGRRNSKFVEVQEPTHWMWSPAPPVDGGAS